MTAAATATTPNSSGVTMRARTAIVARPERRTIHFCAVSQAAP